MLDVADVEAYDRIVALGDDRIRPILFHHAGKRSALGVGIREARCELVCLVDSDTFWMPGLLRAVKMPFEDSQVGPSAPSRTCTSVIPASGVASPTGWSTSATWIMSRSWAGRARCHVSPVAPPSTDGRQ